jgi:hypothetical protein
MGEIETKIIEVQLAPALPAILGDATQLRQVIHNLLQNAQDAIAEKIPELGCFDKFNYHELIIRFIDKMSDSLDVPMKSGLAQGCPHSGPLFSGSVEHFATKPTLEQHPQVGKCGISDDTVFYGPVELVFPAIDTFVHLMGDRLGLAIQSAKSVAFCPNGNETIRKHCEARGFKMEDGIVVGGSYIGKTPWVDARRGGPRHDGSECATKDSCASTRGYTLR